MKKIIMTLVLLAIATTSNAKVWTDEDFETPKQRAARMERVEEKKKIPQVSVNYVRPNSYGIEVNFTATHKGWVTCNAFDNQGNIIESATHWNDLNVRTYIMKDPGGNVKRVGCFHAKN